MSHRQVAASIIIGLSVLFLIIRLVQRGRLDIAYCWLWLGVGAGMVLVVLKYSWLVALSDVIGAKLPTTTLFLLGMLVILLMCLQFSIVISSHRREIRRLTQQVALMRAESPAVRRTDERA
jgi:hypothetical protein